MAAKASESVNEYPAADYWDLRTAIAAYTGVSVEQVVPGAGADELIRLCAQAFLPADQGVAISATPTYPMYAVASGQRGVELTKIPRPAPDFVIPANAMVKAAASADLVWLCQPNNPIGRRDSDEHLSAIMEAAAGIVVLDAAYAEYSSDNWSRWLGRYDNLIVLGTMSKAFGLAGIRVGYATAGPELAARLRAVRPPGSISGISAALALRALEDVASAEERVRAVVAEKDHLNKALADFGWRVVPSSTNFLAAEVGPAAHEIEAELMGDGLVVRKFGADGPLADYLRFTIRSPEQNGRLIDALRAFGAARR